MIHHISQIIYIDRSLLKNLQFPPSLKLNYSSEIVDDRDPTLLFISHPPSTIHHDNNM